MVPAFDVVQCVMIGFFLLEIGLSCACLEGYSLSFFFWMDLISTACMLLDVSAITIAIYSTGTGAVGSNDFSTGPNNLSRITKNTKASRVVTRVVKIFKLLRLMRIVKLYRSAA